MDSSKGKPVRGVKGADEKNEEGLKIERKRLAGHLIPELLPRRKTPWQALALPSLA